MTEFTVPQKVPAKGRLPCCGSCDNPYGRSKGGDMPDRNSLLGRSRPSESLTREEIADLDKVTAPQPRSQPVSTPAKLANPKKLKVPTKALNFHWSFPCPPCGRKAAGTGCSEIRPVPRPLWGLPSPYLPGCGKRFPGNCGREDGMSNRGRHQRFPAAQHSEALQEAVSAYWRSQLRKTVGRPITVTETATSALPLQGLSMLSVVSKTS